jgi:hypothetical protein
MRLTFSAVCLAATSLVALDRAGAQVTDVAGAQTPNEREYWEDRTFGADEFWRDYTRWYAGRPVVTHDERFESVYGARPSYGRLAYPHPDADYVNPRLRGYNPRLPEVDPRRIPYTVRRPYTAHELRLLEENDFLVPDSFEAMDEDVSRWPAQYRDYYDFYQDDVYRRPSYFWPASGLGPRPPLYWR